MRKDEDGVRQRDAKEGRERSKAAGRGARNQVRSRAVREMLAEEGTSVSGAGAVCQELGQFVRSWSRASGAAAVPQELGQDVRSWSSVADQKPREMAARLLQ